VDAIVETLRRYPEPPVVRDVLRTRERRVDGGARCAHAIGGDARGVELEAFAEAFG
jgi:hypothetical protein